MAESTKERVYLPGTEDFGDLQQRGVLGVTNAYKVIDDQGKRTLFIGKTVDDVVLVNENRTGGGKEFTGMPVDIIDRIRRKNLEQNEFQEYIRRYRQCANRREKESLLEEAERPRPSQKQPSQKRASQKKTSQKRASTRRKRATT